MNIISLLGRWVLIIALMVQTFNVSAQTVRKRVVEHVVRHGETVYSIAQRYGTTTDEVYKINSWARERIKEGDKLVIVTTEYQVAPSSDGSSSSAGTTTLSIGGEHTIAAGETLYRVAKNYGVSEDELIRINPGLSAEHFPIGRTIRIPRTQASIDTALSGQGMSSLGADRSAGRVVRLLLMMPLVKTPRYLEFYQGFLMGMNDLKKDGISMNLTVLDAERDEDVSTHIFNGALSQPYDFVIGGVTDAQVEMLARATRLGYYIVPFASSTTVNDPHMIRLNQSPTEVASRVIPRFIRRYRDNDICFVYRTEDREDPFIQRLKSALTQEGISYRTLNLSRSEGEINKRTSVLIPISPDRALAERTISLARTAQASVFGYPQWQSYGDTFVSSLGQVRATIYSSFFFDAESTAGKQFLTKYNAWYSKKLLNGFPRYGVLGYDVARYFIRAHALMGGDFIRNSFLLTSDGLQLDINLEKVSDQDGYVNRSFYFISFSPDGSITRLPL